MDAKRLFLTLFSLSALRVLCSKPVILDMPLPPSYIWQFGACNMSDTKRSNQQVESALAHQIKSLHLN